MSEPEFEMYLSLMSKLLRLNGAQKADIAEELRGHLEERLVQLTAQGKSREEAIRLALDEFGDAGALACQFARPHSLRRRRQIMRYSIGSFVALAGIFTLVSLMWPSQQDAPPAVQAVSAQSEEGKQKAESANPIDVDSSPSQKIVQNPLQNKLDQRGGEFNFVDMDLEDAINKLSEMLDKDILFEQMPESGSSINLQARSGALSYRSALELILRQGSNGTLDYVIKDGVILLTASNKDYEVQVHDCRDLLAEVELTEALKAQFAVALAGETFPSTSPAGAALMNVILFATQPAQWMINNDEGGSLSEFNGMLVVRHTQAVHRKIEDVLKKLRMVKHGKQLEAQPQPQPQSETKPLVIPPGKRLVTISPGNWQVPVGTIKVGSRVDIAQFEPGEDGATLKPAFTNMEIAAYSVRPVDNNAPPSGDASRNVFVTSLSFVVFPEQAVELKEFQERASHLSNNMGSIQCLLRGDDEEDGDDSKAAAEEGARATRLLKELTDTVLAFLPESLRDRVDVTAELVNLEVDRSRFYPLIGQARLARGRYRYLIDYRKIAPGERPQPLRDSSEPQWVVYEDVNRLIRDR